MTRNFLYSRLLNFQIITDQKTFQRTNEQYGMTLKELGRLYEMVNTCIFCTLGNRYFSNNAMAITERRYELVPK